MSGTDSAYRVETTSRLAQWRIENLSSCNYRKSNPFKIGKWNWHLSVEKNRTLFVRLFPGMTNVTRENPPVASFKIKVVSSVGDHKCLVHPEVIDKQLRSTEDFVWALDVPLTGKFIIDVEFLDLKTASPDGSELYSIWGEGRAEKQSNETALSLLGRMLSESIHADAIINTSDGKISAHRAILAPRSPVFYQMFSQIHLEDKETSSIDIADMSSEACQALLNYIYGNIRDEEFLTHRLSLLRAADKYEISDLKEACHESLSEDIDSRNVLERLQYAGIYRLPKLKRSCIQYLVKFGKIYDVRDDFYVFLQYADSEVIAEIFAEVLGTWKGF